MASSSLAPDARGRTVTGPLWLLLLFVGSGCSALIYEIVWFQTLQLIVGSSAISLGVLLATFMGGMCLGSLVFAPLVSARFHPLRVYAVLELGIGLIGLALPLVMPAVGSWYLGQAGAGTASVLWRAVIAGACLLPPTMLMGATLPAIARWMESTADGVARLGLFYAANIAGAVFGCLLTAFYLLRVYDLSVATFAAVAINATVAVLGWLLASHWPYQPLVSESVESRASQLLPAARTPYLVIAFSGFAALGAEVVWTRELSLLLGASVYTFSIILAVFLVGLGIGSNVGAFWSRETAQPGRALALCQMGAAASAAWAAWMLARSLPYWPIDPSLSWSPWFGFQLDMARCMWSVLPAAFFWGASFPLALAATARQGQDSGRLVGRVYASNTVGAIVGALAFSLVAIPRIGVWRSQQLLVGVGIVSALWMLIAGWRRRTLAVGAQVAATPAVPAGEAVLATLALIAGVLLIWTLPKAAPGVVAYGRFLVTWKTEPTYLYEGEGVNASIAVSQMPEGVLNFHVSGKVVASSEPQDMRLQRMLGHLPALLHDHPKTVLVVGCGAGVTAGSFVVHPEIERIVICEIEPLIPQAAGKFFAAQNHGVIDDPRVTVIFDDARHFLATTREKFDIITSDPIHPWVKGAAALYSREYFEICKAHLNPGGVVTQWVPLYESNEDAVKSEIATFFEGFPQGTIWSNDFEGRGYDLVLLANSEVEPIDLDALETRFRSPEYDRVRASMTEVDLASLPDLLSRYTGRKADLGPWLADAQLNADSNLRLQYLAGWGLNSYLAEQIYDSLLPYRHYPDSLFAGSDAKQQELRARIEAP